MKRAAAALCVVLAIALGAAAWVPEFTGGQPDHWDFSSPVAWSLNPNPGSKVHGSRSVRDVMIASFATWTNFPNASVNVVRGGENSINRVADAQGINLVCFVCSDADFTQDSTTLAVTITTTANSTGGGHFVGQILKSDIIFNPAVDFTTDGTGGGEDLQAVATHEIGHFFGLDHTGVVRAVMFPAASDVESLSYDDAAGLATTYPRTPQAVPAGSISGTVSFATGGGVFGAHVFAESTTSATPFGLALRKSPISTLTRSGGAYTISGVPADSYTVTAEPLDGPVTDGDVTGYASTFGQSQVQTSFTTRSH